MISYQAFQAFIDKEVLSMNNKEILEQILLAIDDKRHRLYEQLGELEDDSSPMMSEVYCQCIPNELYTETCELFDFSDFDEDEKLLHLFGEDGLSAIRAAQKAAINKAKEERTDLLVF